MKHCLLAVLCALPLGGALAADEMAMTSPGEMKWVDAPPSMPKGAKIAVLHGDPGKPGPFTMRLKVPAGYKVAPHTHTQAENLTVISGALYLGMGEKMEMGKAHALKAGAFHYLPGKTPHYAFTKSPTVVQAHGEGPFDLNYIHPADNPDKSAVKQ
ncbi:MAG TPA: cupin domain-containing protein [Burkholderiaceae bacterium]|jgi:quercetin dioxygenase-like cupin family protein|nr:cupin domain-containing protein [Burkholderiaceae bacterium]